MNTVYDAQMRANGNMSNTVFDTQMGSSGLPQTKIGDTQMGSSGFPQTKIGGTQMLSSGFPQTKIVDTQMRSSGFPPTKMVDTQMRSSGIPQTKLMTKETQAYVVPQPILPGPRGTDFEGGDERAFEAVDANKDGVISFGEFTAARAASNPVNGPGGRMEMQTQKYQVPVKKSKVEVDNVTKTVYEAQIRSRCVPKTKMVKKQIPVYNVVPKPAPPCPPGTECGGDKRAFDAVDTNKDGVISYGEFTAARAAGNPVGNPVPTYLE